MSTVVNSSLDPSHHNSLPPPERPKTYFLSGKVMLTTIIILFAIVVILVIFHLYARWYILRVRRRYLIRRRIRRQRATHLIFYVDPNNPNGVAVPIPSTGLPADVINSLPVFIYSKKDDQPPVECAVCLSEFVENEEGRVLPKCNHSFHTECIDMWFESHSTCPLCRSPVEPLIEPESGSNPPDVTISVSCESGQHEHSSGRPSSLAGRRKGLDMTVDVPRRTELDVEFRMSSPASSGFKSPGSRLYSLKRYLSMSRGVSPSSGVGPSYVSNNDSDIESCKCEFTRVQTPRLRSNSQRYGDVGVENVTKSSHMA